MSQSVQSVARFAYTARNSYWDSYFPLRLYSSISDLTWELADSTPVAYLSTFELAGARHIAGTAMTKKGNAFEGTVIGCIFDP